MRCRSQPHSVEMMEKLQRFVKISRFLCFNAVHDEFQVKKEMTIPGEDEPTGIIQPLKENIALGLEQAKMAAM